MRRLLIAVMVLSSILLGSLAAGTPVAGSETVASVTAGINLGTAPSRAAAPIRAAAELVPVRALVVALLLLLVAAASRWIDLREPPRAVPSLLRALGGDRRGPPRTV